VALASAIESAGKTRGGARHERFGTATLVLEDGTRLDLATTRSETYGKPGALPEVREGASIAEDLARRDFTVHAMAVPLRADGELGGLVDPFHGRADLMTRRIALLHPRSLVDDPTRALRAVRYGARLDFRWDAAFDEALAASRDERAWRNVSGDRLRRGLEEILAESAVFEAIVLLTQARILDDVVPGWSAFRGEIPFDEGGVSGRWVAFLAPLDPALRRAVAERLNFSRRLKRACGLR
jgi:tRNA nucleotidyltransferase (CCA-adding enzyme)